jgi:hypothetical protein
MFSKNYYKKLKNCFFTLSLYIRESRFLDFLIKTFIYLYLYPGHQNLVADALSRPHISSVSLSPATPPSLIPIPLSYTAMASAQQTDESLNSLKNSSSLHITYIPFSSSIHTG